MPTPVAPRINKHELRIMVVTEIILNVIELRQRKVNSGFNKIGFCIICKCSKVTNIMLIQNLLKKYLDPIHILLPSDYYPFQNAQM